MWSESERGEEEEEGHPGDRWMRRRGRRHWRDVRGVVLKGQLAPDKRLCAIWLDELIQVSGIRSSRQLHATAIDPTCGGGRSTFGFGA
jgi:hypothetical protein